MSTKWEKFIELYPEREEKVGNVLLDSKMEECQDTDAFIRKVSQPIERRDRGRLTEADLFYYKTEHYKAFKELVDFLKEYEEDIDSKVFGM